MDLSQLEQTYLGGDIGFVERSTALQKLGMATNETCASLLDDPLLALQTGAAPVERGSSILGRCELSTARIRRAPFMRERGRRTLAIIPGKHQRSQSLLLCQLCLF